MQPAAGRGRGRGPGSPPVTRSQSDAAGRGSDTPRSATSGGKRQQKKKGPKNPKPDTPKEDPNQDVSTPPPAEGPGKDTGPAEGGPGTVASTNASSVNSPMVAPTMDPNAKLFTPKTEVKPTGSDVSVVKGVEEHKNDADEDASGDNVNIDSKKDTVVPSGREDEDDAMNIESVASAESYLTGPYGEKNLHNIMEKR